MFEDYTAQGRQCVVNAQEEARVARQPYVASEHLLLGLLTQPDSYAGRVPKRRDIELGDIRSQVLKLGRSQPEPVSQMPYMPGAMRVLEVALQRAIELDHDWIGTPHLLLGV